MDNLKLMSYSFNQLYKALCVLSVGCICMTSKIVYADIFECRGGANVAVFVDEESKSRYEHCRLIRATLSSIKNNNQNHFSNAPNRQSKGDAGSAVVDKKTQVARDEKRKQILLWELSSERNALEKSKILRVSQDIDIHQKNIGLLQKEISAIK